MYEVSKCAPQEALRDLDQAFHNFFRGLKRTQKVGFPKFKKRGYKDSFRLTGTIKISNKSIQLPRLGSVRLKEESALKLARQHRKIRNNRRDFLHKCSMALAKTKSMIIIEDLDIKGMLNGYSKINRPIHDAGWREFRRMLEYKTTWYGSKLIVSPRYYPSSKQCSRCGFLMAKMPLSVRDWTCQNCHSHHDRDINAAKNLLQFYTGSSPGIYACGDPSGGGTENWSTSQGSLKQELMNGTFVHKL